MDIQTEIMDSDRNNVYSMIEQIYRNTSSIDLKIHNRYTEEDWRAVQRKLKKYIYDAGREYENLELNSSKYPNDKAYEQIGQYYKEIDKRLGDEKELIFKGKRELVGKDKMYCEGMFTKLFNMYDGLTYSFQTASREAIEGKDIKVSADKIGMILLCKNVRIMEDLINKICSNNIDKSIIGGEKHFDSMRYGFEWLFCHNDISRSDSYKRVDIRDRNRYLDYIKYQIMVTGQYVEVAPKSSTDIDWYYLQIEKAFDRESFEDKTTKIKSFKEQVVKLIDEFFYVYELLIKYRDALFHEEEIRKELGKTEDAGGFIGNNITADIINLSSVAVRVLLDRFVSFVKINDLNFGNSTFNRSWFNYSELSSSNYAGSNFKYARIENAKVKNCDISTCNLSRADGGHTDFSYSNFNYSNLTGINLIGATVNYCEFQNAIFRDANIDSYQDAVKNCWGKDMRSESGGRVNRLIELWNSLGDGTDPLKEIVSAYKDMVFSDLKLSDEVSRVTILKYDIKHEERTAITGGIRRLLKQYFEKHISAELLSLIRNHVSMEIEDVGKRRINKYGKVLLDTANLDNISAKCTQMSNSDLCHVLMQNASFEDADLSGTVMHYTKAQYTSFIRSNLNNLDCFESDYYSANFSNVIMNNALFLDCNLNSTNWNKAIMINSIFVDFSNYVDIIMKDQSIESIELQINKCFDFDKFDNKNQRVIIDMPNYKPYKYTSIVSDSVTHWQTDCSINNAAFTNVLADNTVFLDIIADRSSFNHSSLKNALLVNCKMYLSDFIGVDFRYAYLSLCCMGQSNFEDANITGAKICNVDFSNCNMSGTLLNLSKLNHVLFENSDLRGINLSSAQIKNSAFVNCNFNNAIMSGARFQNCIFLYIKFHNLVGVHSAEFENCYANYCVSDYYNGGGHEIIRKLDSGEFFPTGE